MDEYEDDVPISPMDLDEAEIQRQADQIESNPVWLELKTRLIEQQAQRRQQAPESQQKNPIGLSDQAVSTMSASELKSLLPTRKRGER